MAINKKLIHFNLKSSFETELANNNLLDTSIVFIKDTKEIWTHGQLYKCSDPDLSAYLTADDLEDINSAIGDLETYTASLENNKLDKNEASTTYATKAELPVKIGTDEGSGDFGFIFIDEDDAPNATVYNKTEIDDIVSALQTQVSNIKVGMPVVNIDSSTTSTTLQIGKWHNQTLSSSAVTYTLPSTGTYTATSTDAIVEEIWLEFEKSSGSVSFSGSVIWPNAETPTFSSGVTYQISFTAKYTSDSTVKWLAAVSQSYTV